MPPVSGDAAARPAWSALRLVSTTFAPLPAKTVSTKCSMVSNDTGSIGEAAPTMTMLVALAEPAFLASDSASIVRACGRLRTCASTSSTGG